MFLEQTKRLLNSSSFRFTFYVMGSSWLLFAIVLLLLYQAALMILWETMALDNAGLRRIERFLEYSDQNPDTSLVEKELRKISVEENLKIEIMIKEESIYGNPGRDIEEGTAEMGNIMESGDIGLEGQVIFSHLFSRFWSPRPFEVVLNLDDTRIILVTIDGKNLKRPIAALKSALIACISFTFVLFLSTIVYYSRRTTGRLKDINKICDAVSRGKLSERVPVTSRSDDYDSLAVHVNLMLDRIQSLLQGVQQISDNIAHDLRTPLTHFRNKLEHIECSDADKCTLLKDADRILSLFNSLLSITKLEHEATNITKQTFLMDTLLNDLVELYEPIAEEKEIYIFKNFLRCSVEANKDLIFQAFSNLVDNAIKYSPSKGRIYIEIKKSEETFMTVSVQDSGEGIPVEKQHLVFRRMYQLEKHRRGKGNGLGLTMVKAILDHHGWTIDLKNIKRGFLIEINIPI